MGMGKDTTLHRPQPARSVARTFTRQHWPLLVAVAVLLLIVYALRVVSLRQTRGLLIYPLDDAYIHMAMAKNLVEHRVWGVTSDGFTSTSSGPLWTLLLAGIYQLTGVNSVSPFIMNLVSACLVLLIAYVILRTSRMPPKVVLLSLLAIIWMTPLPALIFVGMEHTLQIALDLAATFLAARVLASADPRPEHSSYYWLLGLAPLITSIRFEGAFLILVISLGFFLRRQWRRGLLLGLLGLLPIAVYGTVSRLHGWPWLPTSVLLKSGFSLGTPPELLLARLVHRLLGNAWAGMHLVGTLMFVALLDAVGKRRGERAWNAERVMTGIFIGTGVLQFGLAMVGWFYRYEAYLVALGILVISYRFKAVSTLLGMDGAPKPGGRTTALEGAAVLWLLVSLFFCLMRGMAVLKDTPRATVNIFEQQYQMATFVRRYYQHSMVALNDAGAVNFFADIHCLDLWGLASPEVARLKLQGEYRRQDMARLAMKNGARIAILHDLWFRYLLGGVPSEWIRVGEWQIHNNVATASDTVSLYALDASEVEPLAAHLTEFSRELPSDIVQSGPYMQPVRSNR